MSAASLVQNISKQLLHLRTRAFHAASTAYVSCHVEKILRVLMWFTMGLLVCIGTMLMILAVLWCCFLGGVASSVAVRHFMLHNIPEQQVLPVEVELAPMQTESWRWLDYTASIKQSWEGDSGRWLRLQAASDALPPSSSSRKSVAEDSVKGCENQDPLDDEFASREETTDRSSSACSGGRSANRNSDARGGDDGIAVKRDNAAAQALSLQMSLIADLQQRRWTSLVCHGLVRIRGVPSEDDDGWSSDLFLPAETHIFNAVGAYSAKLQLVFLKKTRGRSNSHSRRSTADPVSISVHTTMLAVPLEHSQKPTPPLWKLATVFRREHGTSMFLGDDDGDDRFAGFWLFSLVTQWMDVALIVPRAALRFAWSLFQEGSGPFPPLASDGSEVAVELPLYQRFHPPMELQPRLAALNMSVFQRIDSGHQHEHRLHVVRANVFFTVQLEGLPYLLTEYPLISSAMLTGGFFVMYVLWCVCISVGIMSGGVFLALKL
jgi:hypothetical protein